jgi:hypothetical protein
MKVTYDEKTNNDFTPFRLILEFESREDLVTFNGVLFDAELRLAEFIFEHRERHYELINHIKDVINLKIER